MDKSVVDYDDPANWSIDNEYFNRHPLITRAHFPIDRSGSRKVTYRLVDPERMLTTAEVLEGIGKIEFFKLRRPNLAETRVFHQKFPKWWADKPVLSLCGACHEQGGHPFIAYAQGEGERFNLFFNWMGFKLMPSGVILAIAE
ncbi:MAG: hypothetical protein AAB424_01725 [Patescibacteria group bacterium]